MTYFTFIKTKIPVWCCLSHDKYLKFKTLKMEQFYDLLTKQEKIREPTGKNNSTWYVSPGVAHAGMILHIILDLY